MKLTEIKEIIKFLVDNFPNSIEKELKLQKHWENTYFGQCSICGKHDGYLNIRSAQYFVCHKHKKCWCHGYNMFSDWKEEDEEIWKMNFKKIQNYQDISGFEWYERKKEKIEQKFPQETPRHFLSLLIEEIHDFI